LILFVFCSFSAFSGLFEHFIKLYFLFSVNMSIILL
jgi:hypothetical protein